MKEKIPMIAGGVLGLLFLIFGSNFFLKFIDMPSPAEGSPMAAFAGTMYATGYLAFVKVLEIIGGILVAVPKTRNLGLLILTPIIVNILAIHVYVTDGQGLFDPPVVLITLLCAFLIVSARKQIAQLLN
jgi:putative oxidoreductase